MEEVIKFLTGLSANNNREWFQANRKAYETAKKRYTSLVDQTIREIASYDLRLAGVKAPECMFRINRDIRFSKDKSPYKTHFGAYMARGGRKSPEGAYYMHVSPDEVFIAGGVYAPEKEVLKVIRQEIMFQPEKYLKLTENISEAGFSQMREDALKNGPKDFPKDSPYIDLIKYKHYIFSRTLTDAEKYSSGLPQIAGAYFKVLHPLNEFLNTAMEFTGNE